MKRLIRMIILTCFTLGVLIVASYAWFTNTELVEPKISGYSVAAYFGGGDGSAEHPFEIKNKRHLYNLAWLQYLGYFNKYGVDNVPDADQNNPTSSSLTQYSFILNVESELDMSGWNLPPIGTTRYPFIGTFNGNGKTITNLNTTNNFNEFGTRHPAKVIDPEDTPGENQECFANAEIIGFVGTIGTISGMIGSGYTVSSSKNNLVNVKLKQTTVTTGTAQTLCGIVAGYINANVANVGIVKGTLDVGTTTAIANRDSVSSYTVAGYATEDYVTKVSNNKTVVMNPVTKPNIRYTYEDEGDITGWGGSVAMSDTFNRLRTISSSYAVTRTSSQYYIDRYAYPDYQGNKYETGKSSMSLGTDKYYMYNSDVINNYNQAIGSFNFAFRGNGNPSSYTYLNSGHRDSYVDGYKITDGTHYMRIIVSGNTPTIGYTEDSDLATPFLFSNVSGSSSTIYTYIDGTQYNLRNNNGELQISTSSTTWGIKNSNGRMIICSDYYDLVFDNGWKLSSAHYISSSNTSNYLSVNGTNIQNQSNVSNATKWYVDTNGRLYTIINNRNYYLKVTNNSTLSLDQTANNGQQWTINTSTVGRITFSYTPWITTYYLRYENNSWKVTSSSANLYRSHFESNIEKYSLSDTSPVMDYSGNDVTYFPLNVNSNFTAKDINTGYIIGGTRGTSAYGSIRISAYGQKNGSNYNLGNYNYSSGHFNANSVYTIDNNNQIVTINDTNNSFKKYLDSKSKIEKIISDTPSALYGLHFMDDPVSKNNIVTAKYALIDKVTYPNYQLPVSTIDFNLHSKGYVNFFAGTYGAANKYGDNAFFSVHQVFRDSSKNIVDIREIESIYSNGEENSAYIYKYKGGNYYSAPYTFDAQGNRVYSNGDDENSIKSSIPSGYNLVFNTNCLAANRNIVSYRRQAFYFEIPMNDGEFVLGSVTDDPGNLGDDISGAYLMYLDISANAQQVDRTEIQQKTTVTKYDYAYPNGIAIIDDNATPTSVNAALSPVVKVTSLGTIILQKDAQTTFSASGTIPTSVALVSNYIPRGVVLYDVSTSMQATAVRTTKSMYSMIQYIDYNITKQRTFETDIIRSKTVIDDDIDNAVDSDIGVRIYELTSSRTSIYDSNNSSIGGTDPTATTLAWKLTGLISDNLGGYKNLSFRTTEPQPKFAGESDTIKNKRSDLLEDLIDTLDDIFELQEIIQNGAITNSILEYDYDTKAEYVDLERQVPINNTFDSLITSIKDTSNTNGTYYKFTGDNITVTSNDTGEITVYITKRDTNYTFIINGTARTANFVL